MAKKKSEQSTNSFQKIIIEENGQNKAFFPENIQKL